MTQDHLASCGYVEERCPNGCGAEYIRADQEDHLTTCPAKPILCQWCGETVPKNRIDVSML